VAVGVGASAGAQEVVAMANRINAESININLVSPHPSHSKERIETIFQI